MTDREKVLKGLKCCKAKNIDYDYDACDRCPYNGRTGGEGCYILYADALSLLEEVAEKMQYVEEENNFLKSMQHGCNVVRSAEMKIQKIKAEFIGRDGSMHFRTGKVYDLWFLEKNGRYYISRPRMDATAIPYDTMIAVKKNWNILNL